jgi:hypothetical protein
MRYSTVTTASVTEIMERARKRFGPSGLGLRVTSMSMLEATFSGEIGNVTVAVQPLGRGKNDVVIASQEFDDEAARFVRDLPRESVGRRLLRGVRSRVGPRPRT